MEAEYRYCLMLYSTVRLISCPSRLTKCKSTQPLVVGVGVRRTLSLKIGVGVRLSESGASHADGSTSDVLNFSIVFVSGFLVNAVASRLLIKLTESSSN